jgi:hypothetical protein
MGSYELIALVLVLAIPAVGMAIVAGGIAWARDTIARAPVPGSIGVACTIIAAANLFVARTCGGSTNRPIVAMALPDDPCQRSALIAVELVLLLVVATATVVRLPDLRR